MFDRADLGMRRSAVITAVVHFCLRCSAVSVNDAERALDDFFGGASIPPPPSPAPKISQPLDVPVTDPPAEIPKAETGELPSPKVTYRYAPGVGVDAGGAFMWNGGHATTSGGRRLAKYEYDTSSTYASRRLLSGEAYNHPGELPAGSSRV